MKNIESQILIVLTSIFCLIMVPAGCKSNQAPATALATDAALIAGVNGAMQTFAVYANAGKATAAQISTVSNAYSTFYQSELILSNLASAYVANPSTNLLNAETVALATVVASQSNIVTIVNTFTK